MKGFIRKNILLSLCGLNCGLCPLFLGKYCGGCGNGNQSCKIARCSIEQGNIEYCFKCERYPCEKYQFIDQFDSFITHRRQKSDLEKAREIGIDAYNFEQKEKMKILDYLLSNFNDGRKKTFFCVAVNLLELSELQEALNQIKSNDSLSVMTEKERCTYVADVFRKIADRRKVELKLHKKRMTGMGEY